MSISADPNDPEVQAIAAFLRVLNALENIRSSINVAERGRTMATAADMRELARPVARGNHRCDAGPVRGRIGETARAWHPVGSRETARCQSGARSGAASARLRRRSTTC